MIVKTNENKYVFSVLELINKRPDLKNLLLSYLCRSNNAIPGAYVRELDETFVDKLDSVHQKITELDFETFLLVVDAISRIKFYDYYGNTIQSFYANLLASSKNISNDKRVFLLNTILEMHLNTKMFNIKEDDISLLEKINSPVNLSSNKISVGLFLKATIEYNLKVKLSNPLITSVDGLVKYFMAIFLFKISIKRAIKVKICPNFIAENEDVVKILLNTALQGEMFGNWSRVGYIMAFLNNNPILTYLINDSTTKSIKMSYYQTKGSLSFVMDDYTEFSNYVVSEWNALDRVIVVPESICINDDSNFTNTVKFIKRFGRRTNNAIPSNWVKYNHSYDDIVSFIIACDKEKIILSKKIKPYLYSFKRDIYYKKEPAMTIFNGMLNVLDKINNFELFLTLVNNDITMIPDNKVSEKHLDKYKKKMLKALV